MQDPSDVTQLLLRWSQGDQEAVNRLFPTVYEELKRLAHARVRHEHSDHTLNTTALVHEAYIKLVDLDRMNWKDRAHFFALASRVMRHLLVNYAHQRKAMKRGGEWKRVELDEDRLMPDADLQLDRVADGGLVREVDQGLIPDVEVERLLELDEALTQLAAEHPRPAKAVEQSYFGGLTNEETAAVLGISLATVERDLRLARAWLARSLGRELHA